MASAHPYTYSTSDGRTRRAYRAKWSGGAKRGFARRSDALAYAQDREAEARHGITLAGETPTSRTTVEGWSQTWLDGLDVRPSTRASYEYALRRILPGLGSRTLGDLRPSELKAWRRGLTRADGQPLAPATADATVAVLAMMLRAAVLDGLIERSPLVGVKGSSGSRVLDPDELLTLEQVEAWGRALPVVACEMPVVAAMTGLRQGELLGLRLPQIDFLRRQVRVVEQLVSPPGAGVPTWGPPKTAAGVRTVPLPEPAAEALARHLGRFPAVDGEPVFRSVRGKRWRRSTFGDVWRKGKAGADLPVWAHWHGLRDHAASAYVRAGVDVRTVMTLLGHTNPKETLATYSRLWPDSNDLARKAVEELWRKPGERGLGSV
jgi:integrase